MINTSIKSHENLSKLNPITVKSEYDVKNHVHIIHVGAHDPYENVIGSLEFSKIIEKAELNVYFKFINEQGNYIKIFFRKLTITLALFPCVHRSQLNY